MLSWLIFLIKNFKYLNNHRKECLSEEGSLDYEDYLYIHSLLDRDYLLKNIDVDVYRQISRKIMLRISFYENFNY